MQIWHAKCFKSLPPLQFFFAFVNFKKKIFFRSFNLELHICIEKTWFHFPFGCFISGSMFSNIESVWYSNFKIE
jgi:hypothetical protein